MTSGSGCTFISALACSLVCFCTQLSAQNHEQSELTSPTRAIPEVLVREHREIHHELEQLLSAEGEVGVAARKVAESLHPHFVKEEELAMPPLALLRPIAEGKMPHDAAETLRKSRALKEELPAMLKEHEGIKKELEKLASSGQKAGLKAAVEFASKLRNHAEMEEAVLYPAAVLVGMYGEKASRE